jgi:large subunit ribosomal protein L5
MSLPIAELQNEYITRVIPALKEKRGYSNVHQVPRLVKVVINTSIASAPDVKAALEIARGELELITGQKPIDTIAKKAISNFKLRAGQAIGAKVTLRGRIMYEFLERLIKTALPRIRDFRGVSNRAFDGNGNYTLGVADQAIFPEVELDKIKRNIGFDITIVTSSSSDDEARALLSELGVPFAGRNAKKVVKAPGAAEGAEVAELTAA